VNATAYSAGSPYEVQDTKEFRRVLDLRRRDWEETIRIAPPGRTEPLLVLMTRAFKLPHGQQELRPIQAASLADAHDLGGLLAPIRVGDGKTLLTFLLPMVIPGIQRPTLLLRASLVEKTWREFKILAQHWATHPCYTTRKGFDDCVITYEKLGRHTGREKLTQRRPDLLMADEAHRLKNRQAACTKRVERFVIANPETVFCAMSGTITTRSIHDYWHLAYWALRHHTPLPRVHAEMEKWAEALDEKKTSDVSRRDPGVLMQFCTEEERQSVATIKRTAPIGRTQQMPVLHFREKLKVARNGYQRRLRQSPGVICSPDKGIPCSLLIRRCDVDPGEAARKKLQEFRESMEDPNGDLVTTPMDMWRHARELACGFYYKWDPPPPEHWMTARRSWSWSVRNILFQDGIFYHQYQNLFLDSPMQVGLAIHDGKISDPGVLKAYERWQEVKNDYKINTVAEWVDDSTLKYCLGWMIQNESGIVWTEHVAFGERLAAEMGTGFCGRHGKDANGKAIEDYNGAPVVASVAANAEGRNLQAWNRNLVVTAKPTGALWEQLLGRTHRPGQEGDTVYCDWICACDEQNAGFHQLMADARYIQDTTGQNQKLLYADHV